VRYALLLQLPLEDSEIDARQCDDRGEAGGFGAAAGKVQVIQLINHEGEVNRARYCPQSPFVLATKTISADVYVFDYSKHPSKPPAEGLCCPDLRLKVTRVKGQGSRVKGQGSRVKGQGQGPYTA
jgi:histone-binding protein RBBP4